MSFEKNIQYFKFCAYGFLKNLRFFDAFLILFLIEKGMSYTQIGVLYAAREIVTFVFEIPSGIIADSFGRRNSLIASFIIFIFSFLMFYFSNSFIFFIFAFILSGIGDAFRSGTHKGMIVDYLKLNNWQEQKINYYGHTRSWSQKGSALSALIAGIVVFYDGNYQNIFLYSIIPTLINLFMLFSYPTQLNFSSENKNTKTFRMIGLTLKSFFKIIRQINVFKIVTASAIHTAYMKAVKDYIQPLMVQIALLIPFFLNFESIKKNGMVVGVIYFIIYLITSQATKLSGKVVEGRNKYISILTLILGFSSGIICGIFYIYEFWIISLIAFVAVYFIENIRKPILTGFIADNVPSDVLTSVISAQAFLRTIITAVLAFVFGIVADHFGIGISFITVSSVLLFLAVSIKNFKK